MNSISFNLFMRKPLIRPVGSLRIIGAIFRKPFKVDAEIDKCPQPFKFLDFRPDAVFPVRMEGVRAGDDKSVDIDEAVFMDHRPLPCGPGVRVNGHDAILPDPVYVLLPATRGQRFDPSDALSSSELTSLPCAVRCGVFAGQSLRPSFLDNP